jgi:hypothetical protein
MKFEGYGYEYDAKYNGGPADGLESNVVIFNSNTPPEVTCLELHNLVSTRAPLGTSFLKRRPSDSVRVGVYKLENDPTSYCEDDVLTYHFIEILNYSEYVSKYGENE